VHFHAAGRRGLGLLDLIGLMICFLMRMSVKSPRDLAIGSDSVMRNNQVGAGQKGAAELAAGRQLSL